MSNELLDNILDDEIESSTPNTQQSLFDNLLEDEPSKTLKISKTVGKVFSFDDHNLMPYGQSLDHEEETLTFDAPKLKPEPSMSKEEEFVKFVEEEHDGYKDYYTPILNQQVRYLKDIKTSGYDHNSQHITDLTLPAIPRILDNLTITDLIGIQPMTCPVGLIYHMGYNIVNDDIGSKMSFDITSSVVEAGSRKLQAAMTIEAMQDMNSMHGLDIKAEIASAISQEVATEINNEWLSDIRHVAHEEQISIETERELIFKITTASTMIGQRSRRGFGNWIVVNPTMLARIQEAADNLDAELRKNNEKYKDITYKSLKHDKAELKSLFHVGVYRDQINVYCDTYGTDDNEILVGYKGGSGEADTGMIYAPYVMMLSTGVIVDPLTFQPLIKFMTRYGKWAAENASDYYTKLTIE